MEDDIVNPFHVKEIIHGDSIEDINEWSRGLAYRVIVIGSEYLGKLVPDNTHTLPDDVLYEVAEDILNFLWQ